MIGESSATAFVTGRIEVCVIDQWVSVCDNGWDSADAMVACRQLGFSGGKRNCHKTFACIIKYKQTIRLYSAILLLVQLELETLAVLVRKYVSQFAVLVLSKTVKVLE